MFDRLKALAVRPGPSGRWLVRAETVERFFPQADTAWEIFHRLTREEVIVYLDNRKRRGVNVVLGVLIPELDVKSLDGQRYTGEVDLKGVDPEPAPTQDQKANLASDQSRFFPNRYGEIPLHDDDPATPNLAYFEHVDWVINAAADRGIMFWLVPTWSRFTTTGWADGPILFNEDNARSFGEFVGRRYPYTLKVLGGDSNPIWTTGAEMRKRNPPLPFSEPVPEGYELPNSLDLPRRDCTAVIQAMAAGITRGEMESGNDHPALTYHPCPHWLPWSPEALASAFFGQDNWLMMDSCQSGHADCPTMQYNPPINKWNARASHVPISKMWNAGNRPVIDLESHYEQAYNGLRPVAKFMWDEHDIRSGAWQSVLSGACGVVYGANVIWQMFDAARLAEYPDQVPVCGCSEDLTWKSALDLPGLDSITLLKEYFLSLPASVYESRIPAQDLLVDSQATAASRELDGRIDLMKDQTANGSTWLIAHSGMGFAFTLDLAKAFEPGSTVRGAWLDPRTGKRQAIGQVVISDPIRFEPPTSGSVRDDWVLILEAQ